MKTSALSHPTASSTDFRHGTVAANGVRLHYVERGDGPPVLLLPGWPQSWYAWRHVMVRLAAAGRRVIAVDPRGMGDSERPATGYDLATVAADIHAFSACSTTARSTSPVMMSAPGSAMPTRPTGPAMSGGSR